MRISKRVDYHSSGNNGSERMTEMKTLATDPAESMSIEHNKDMARRWSEELWGRGNLVVADEIISRDYVRHDPGDPFPAHGPDDVKRIVSALRGMLPDFAIH